VRYQGLRGALQRRLRALVVALGLLAVLAATTFNSYLIFVLLATAPLLASVAGARYAASAAEGEGVMTRLHFGLLVLLGNQTASILTHLFPAKWCMLDERHCYLPA
jgi:hypothetical protein